MSDLPQKYELPANGRERVSNSAIAAALAAIGIGGARQETEHRKRGNQDWRYFSFHLVTESTLFRGFKTSTIVSRLQQGEIPRDGPWDEPTKLFMSAWIALENRRVFLEAVHQGTVPSLTLRRIGEGLCRLEHPVHGNVHDLRIVARDSGEELSMVKSAVMMRALMTVGFSPVHFRPEGCMMTNESLTFPGLTLAMCFAAYGEIDDYNRRVAEASGIIPPPPDVNLPGAAPGYHPFQYAVQGQLNLTQILDYILPKAGKTFCFQSPHEATRSALIDATAGANEIHQALEYANKR